jgi:hypothetical protein
MKTLSVIVIGLTLAQTSLAQITVSSSAFQSGGTIPAQFTCKGTNSNPPLQFHGIPKEAKSLVLIVDDTDAPGGLFTHWIVWNIDPGSARIDENSIPAGAIEGTNDFRQDWLWRTLSALRHASLLFPSLRVGSKAGAQSRRETYRLGARAEESYSNAR